MSMGTLNREFGEGGGWAPSGSSRRRIEPSDIAFAQARRPRTSWQALAKMLGVNAEDLRKSVEATPNALKAVGGPKPAEPAPAKPSEDRSVGLGGGSVQVLLAVAAGATRPVDIAATLGMGAGAASNRALRLRRLGLIDARYALTADGRAMVRTLNHQGMVMPALKTGELSAVRTAESIALALHIDRVIVALDRGARSFGEVSAATGLELIGLYAVVSRARQRGFVGKTDHRGLHLTDAGVARLRELEAAHG